MGDKLLFTPGPLTTSPGVKQATLHDLGSRDLEFIELVHSIRAGLLNVAGVAGRGYEAILVQGCGTMGIEAVVSSTVPRDGKLLVVINGAYGRRIATRSAATFPIRRSARRKCRPAGPLRGCGPKLARRVPLPRARISSRKQTR